MDNAIRAFGATLRKLMPIGDSALPKAIRRLLAELEHRKIEWPRARKAKPKAIDKGET
jgi:hypothetical protein